MYSVLVRLIWNPNIYARWVWVFDSLEENLDDMTYVRERIRENEDARILYELLCGE